MYDTSNNPVSRFPEHFKQKRFIVRQKSNIIHLDSREYCFQI